MARDFAGSVTSYLIASSSSIVDITGTEITISCWVNPDGVAGTTYGLVTKLHSLTATVRQFELFLYTNNVPGFGTATNSAGGLTEVLGSNPVKVGVWSHILGRQNASVQEVWHNGKLEASSAVPRTMTNSSAWFLLGMYHNSDLPLDGKLAEVGVWDHCLSPDEIRQLYRGASPASIRPSKLRGYWPLNDYGISGVARDRSPYNQTLDMSAAGVAFTPQHPPIGNLITFYGASIVTAVPSGPPTVDSDTIYLNLQVSGTDEYNPPCFLIGEGEAQLRWTTSDDFLRWLGNDANLRWDAQLVLGTAQC